MINDFTNVLLSFYFVILGEMLSQYLAPFLTILCKTFDITLGIRLKHDFYGKFNG